MDDGSGDSLQRDARNFVYWRTINIRVSFVAVINVSKSVKMSNISFAKFNFDSKLVGLNSCAYCIQFHIEVQDSLQRHLDTFKVEERLRIDIPGSARNDCRTFWIVSSLCTTLMFLESLGLCFFVYPAFPNLPIQYLIGNGRATPWCLRSALFWIPALGGAVT